MILITTFSPLISGNVKTFSDLELSYKNQIEQFGHTTPGAKLQEWLVNGTLYGITLTRRKRTAIKTILHDYQRGLLLTAKPKRMELLVNRYHRAGFNRLIYSGKSSTSFGRALLTAFGYEKRFRSVEDKGLWLANILNIKVCPYCNSQYTMVVKKSDGASLGKFQFDHFFSKDRYPYLSIALYNLIPSCASCNHKKSNDQLFLQKHFNPYLSDLSSVAKFHVEYPSDPTKLTLKEALNLKSDDLKITFRSRLKDKNAYVRTHSELYDIELMYKRHTDIAHELLIKAILYNKHYQQATLAISNLFPDKQTLLRYILGNYLEQGQINQRPLSKFTSDIARQLKLIN